MFLQVSLEMTEIEEMFENCHKLPESESCTETNVPCSPIRAYKCFP